MKDSVFALDANIFIEAHRRYYGVDLCPGFWECLRHYGARQRLLSIDRVRSELVRGRDALSKWVKDGPTGLFVSSAEPEVADVFADVMAWVQGNAQFRREAKAEFAAAADGWLAAYAKVRGAVVVTHERYSADVRRRVPLGNVCHELEVPMWDTFEMLRELEVRFEWTTDRRRHAPWPPGAGRVGCMGADQTVGRPVGRSGAGLGAVSARFSVHNLATALSGLPALHLNTEDFCHGLLGLRPVTGQAPRPSDGEARPWAAVARGDRERLWLY